MEVSERFISFGDSNFLSEVVVPTINNIDSVTSKYPCAHEPDIVLDTRPVACLSGLEAFMGIVVFLGGWTVKKFLDDVYEETFRSVVREKIRTYISQRDNGKKYSLGISLNTKKNGLSVLVCCTGRNIDEIANSETHLERIVGLAQSYFDSEEYSSGVLLFNIDNGTCNLEPEYYPDYIRALNGLKEHYPVRPPLYIKQ